MKRKTRVGKVILVGGGPGDPGLLTLKGREVLQEAEVVVYDWLVGPGLLELAPHAEKIFVGKKGGTRYIEQGAINRMLLRLARRGKNVVRLKGGDPFLFGRGGEEASFLAKHRIPFEVVPGVSAGTGVPVYAGIPLTDRRLSSEVTFVTGHEQDRRGLVSPASTSRVDWKKLAGLGGTLVSFMGVKNLGRIVQELRNSGKPRRTPVAVIEWGTLSHQRVVTGTLEDIVKKCRRARIDSPALTVFGEVVKLRKTLDWFGRKPLYGKKVLVTRARAQASGLVRKLRERGADVVEFPTIEILPPSHPETIDREIARLGEYDWAVFTSVNGVRFFFERMKILRKDARIFAGTRVAAIGEKTAEALEERGIRADWVPPEFTSASLFQSLKLKNEILGKKFLLARADIAPPDFKRFLEKEGGKVVEIEAYRTRPTGRIKDWPDQKFDYITFTSSSTVKNFFELIPRGLRKKIRSRFVTIGPVTSRTLRGYGFRPDREARKHTIEGLIEALENGGPK